MRLFFKMEENGTLRHVMSYHELDHLYRSLGDFEADLTRNEAEMLRGALTAIKTTIHLRMQETYKNR